MFRIDRETVCHSYLQPVWHFGILILVGKLLRTTWYLVLQSIPRVAKSTQNVYKQVVDVLVPCEPALHCHSHTVNHFITRLLSYPYQRTRLADLVLNTTSTTIEHRLEVHRT